MGDVGRRELIMVEFIFLVFLDQLEAN